MNVGHTPVQRRSESVAAVVNGLLVVLVPVGLVLAGSSIYRDTFDASVTARAPGPPRMPRIIPVVFHMAIVLFPFALFTGWRTWVYAIRWCDRKDRGWRAVAEAGVCGLILPLLYLARGILTRPAEAPPYVITYGGAGLLLGVLVGVFLRTTAILVLKLRKCDAA